VTLPQGEIVALLRERREDCLFLSPPRQGANMHGFGGGEFRAKTGNCGIMHLKEVGIRSGDVEDHNLSQFESVSSAEDPKKEFGTELIKTVAHNAGRRRHGEKMASDRYGFQNVAQCAWVIENVLKSSSINYIIKKSMVRLWEWFVEVVKQVRAFKVTAINGYDLVSTQEPEELVREYIVQRLVFKAIVEFFVGGSQAKIAQCTVQLAGQAGKTLVAQHQTTIKGSPKITGP
jgi:hypothetical protein